MRTHQPPDAVRAAFALWLLAIGAGLFETLLVVATGRAGGGAAAGAALRGVVFVAAAATAVRMRAGRNWARWALVAALGVLGTASLLVGPVLWLLDGAPAAALTGAGPVDLAFAGSRALHVAAVLTACVLMFVPAASAHFRSGAVQVADRDATSPGSR